MKLLAKRFVVWILGHQVKRLREKHEFKVVAVSGSIGKTSTKFAIASVLSQKHRVRFQEGNYNDHVTVPLVFFGQELPSLLNPFAWIRVFAANERQIRQDYPIDVVVVELGTDGPGQISEFGKFLSADVGVVTGIAPEHMEFFGTLDAVASEELSISGFSERLLINADLCAAKYLNQILATSYGIHTQAAIRATEVQLGNRGSKFQVERNGKKWLNVIHPSIAEVQLYSLLAAASVADLLGMSEDEITEGFKQVKPVSGRLQILQGIHDSTIIDDTYNASPEAVKAVLDTVYRLDAPQKIALLGNMNELGEYSRQAHEEVGMYCDPKQLNLVVTLGPDANKYLAPTAEVMGCKVIRTDSPYEAAEKIRAALIPNTLILAKGSQNGVFAEEAVKMLLNDPTDQSKLVRQSASWMGVKNKQFKRP